MLCIIAGYGHDLSQQLYYFILSDHEVDKTIMF